MSQGADTLPCRQSQPSCRITVMFFSTWCHDGGFTFARHPLLPQVHPVQERRVVRQTARRTAAVQRRPSRLEVPAGLHRQPLHLRGPSVQGEQVSTLLSVHMSPFLCCYLVFPKRLTFKTQRFILKERANPPPPNLPPPPTRTNNSEWNCVHVLPSGPCLACQAVTAGSAGQL